MTQKKSFFTKNNSLNKRNQVTDGKPLEASMRSNRMDILTEYEALNPDSSAKILEMAKKEQEHEHKMNELKLNMQMRGLRMGRICGLFAILAMGFFSTSIAASGHVIYGLIFAFISFGTLLMLNCKSSGACNNNGNNDRRNRYKSFHKDKGEEKTGEESSDRDNKYRGNRNYHNRYNKNNKPPRQQ